MTTANPRKNMILGQLYTNEVPPHILQAMAAVPREEFVPAHLKQAAYVDDELPIGRGRHLIEPLVLGKLLTLAAITPSDRILLVGCLHGYVAAILAKLSSHVVGIDIDSEAISHAKKMFEQLPAIDIQHVESLASGYGMSAPYNVIVVAGGLQFVPELLGNQLAVDGRLVAIKNIAQPPGAPQGIGRGLLVKRVHHQLHYSEHFDASAALLPGFEQKQGFVF